MLDLTTRAIVLDKEDFGEYNARIFLYTEKLGSIIAYATAPRKLISKLAAHLEPLNIVDVRLVEKKNHSFQIGDALIVRSNLNWKMIPSQALIILKIISMLKEPSFSGNPDAETWELFYNMITRKEDISLSQYTAQFLTILGFNPKHAICSRCAIIAPKYFLMQDFYFYCKACIPRLDSLILEI